MPLSPGRRAANQAQVVPLPSTPSLVDSAILAKADNPPFRALASTFKGNRLADIAQWLSSLDLNKYISAFVEAEVSIGDLPHLTNDDLKDLGLPLGPRRRVEAAVKLLVAGSDANTSELPFVAPSPPKHRHTDDTPTDAERRQLTVMFVDLVGSTEMTTQHDAEDVRHVIPGYQNTVASVVNRNDGFVARYMGDGVLCYFGWPRANEDDAERAVRTGLEIIAQVKMLAAPANITLATRVGIATGVVIVGDLIGTGAAQEAAVVGETPNLAARLQGLAQPNQVIVADETRSLLGNLFDLTPLAGQRLKGIAQPVDTYLVNGEMARESRFDARQTGTLTPIVGRDRELELMLECWAKAKVGAGQMVVVTGEAGIGKSRVTRAVADETAQDSHVRITYQCSAYHTDSALNPVIQQLIYDAGIRSADASDTRLDKLEALAGIDAGIQEGKKAVAVATRTGQQRLVIGANAILGMAYFFRGDLHQAINTTLPDIADLRGRYRHALFETTATSSVNWLGNLAGMHAMIGQFDAAVEYAEEACEQPWACAPENLEQPLS
jgi:class 3 adenylate cyclase